MAAVILGVAGVLRGDGVSAGMTASLRDTITIVAHLWGAMFATGGVLKLVGLYRHRVTLEIPGLWLMAAGYFFYSLTVSSGLGWHGMAAGVVSMASAIGCVLKVRQIMRRARIVGGGAGDLD